MQKRILIIDDDTDLLDLLVLLLSDYGYLDQTNNTGVNFFDQIEEFKPGIILLDINLSGLNGRDILKAIKSTKNTFGIPVIMISADESLYNTIGPFGANDVVRKPFDFDHLTKRIERQISQLRG